MNAATKWVLPADVFDTLEFSALAFGGIGPYAVMRAGRPCCAYGHAAFACGEIVVSSGEAKTTEMGAALWRCGVGVVANDTAVVDINERAGRDLKRRVSFAAWCDEMGVERGS